MANQTGLQFTLTLAGQPALDLAVVDFTFEEALSAPFHLRGAFASRDGGLSPTDWLERELTLTLWQDGEALRHVHGIAAEFQRGDRGHRRTRYEVVIRPALWRLSLRHNSRIFQHVSPLTILNTLCTEHGLHEVAFAVTRELAEREFCVQYRETDLAFLERLAAEEGLYYFHEFEADRHRLVVSDDPTLLTNLGARPYHARAGGTAPRRHVRRLQQASRVKPASVTLKDYSFKTPAYAQLHAHQADGLDEHAQRTAYEHYDAPGRYKADASGR
ncbi:hypothetical protein L861_04850, partial [Litchfieldella anticariensis FP35 = DSM 16096]